MRLLVIFGVVASAVCLVVGSLDESGRLDGAHWRLYKSRFNKVYSDQDEDSMRMRLFLEQKRRVEQHNVELAPELGYTMGLNHLSDWTDGERASLNGFRVDPKQMESVEEEQPEFVKKMMEVDVEDLPKEVDWRKVAGRVTPVKNQGFCGSCWSFSTTGVLEGQEYRFNNNSGQLISLSEQNILDCSRSGQNGGCHGGLMWTALSDIAKEHGIESEQDYPYLNEGNSDDHKCHFESKKSVLNVKGSHYTLNGTEEGLQKLLAQFGPVAVCMEVSSAMGMYRSGVFYDATCSHDLEKINHAVLAVGYGTDPKWGDYWLVKNSWSKLWGEEGYLRIARNKGNDCMLSITQTIPLF